MEKKRLNCCLTIIHVSILSYNQPIVSLYLRYSQRGSGVTGYEMHLSQIGWCSPRKLLCSFNSERTKRDLLNVEMLLWWLRTYTQNPVLLALSHAWSRRDGARSHWIGLNLCRKLRQLFLASFWLCAFPNLAYWIFSFCLWGLFALLDLMGQWTDKREVRRQGANTCCPTAHSNRRPHQSIWLRTGQ